MHSRVSDHSSLANLPSASLELWFDEYDDLPIRSDELPHRWKHELERDEGHVDGGKVQRLGELCEVASVCPLHDHNALVPSQSPGQLAVANVDGVDARSAVLQKTVGEATCRCANVGGGCSLHRGGERLQGRFQLRSAPADIARSRLELDRRSRGDPHAGLVHHPALDQDLASQDHSLGFLTTLRQTSTVQKDV